ncbi:MAG: hypothetical protein ACJAS9_002760, partial [Polaribacter sp.]
KLYTMKYAGLVYHASLKLSKKDDRTVCSLTT